MYGNWLDRIVCRGPTDCCHHPGLSPWQCERTGSYIRKNTLTANIFTTDKTTPASLPSVAYISPIRYCYKLTDIWLVKFHLEKIVISLTLSSCLHAPSGQI